jgi:hypothetical protein
VSRLVGSEMCIRDRLQEVRTPRVFLPPVADEAEVALALPRS